MTPRRRSQQSHAEQVNNLWQRQLQILFALRPEEALEILAAVPATHDAQHAVLADMLQRRLLADQILKGPNHA